MGNIVLTWVYIIVLDIEEKQISNFFLIYTYFRNTYQQGSNLKL